MDAMQLAAIVQAITIENRSLSFYSALSAKVTDLRTKRIFELLAQEEQEHLEHLCDLYPGHVHELVDILFKTNMYLDPYYLSLLNSIEGNENEKYALEIALKEEQACIRCYSKFVETIREPQINTVFAQNLVETYKHSEIIEEEYMRHMRMVDRTDQDIYVRE